MIVVQLAIRFWQWRAFICSPRGSMTASRKSPRAKEARVLSSPAADALRACTVGGLMQHMVQKHGGQTLLEDSVGQVHRLNRQACVYCGTIRPQRCRRCNSCGFDTPLRELCVGDTFQDRRQPGHQDAAASGLATGQQPPQSSQPVPLGEPLDDSPQLIETSSCSASSARLGDGTPALRCLSLRHGLGRKSRGSHERSPVLGLALPLLLSFAPCCDPLRC